LLGRGAKRANAEDEAQVEVHLEWDIDSVERAVAAFLDTASDGARQSLVTAIDRLDSQVDLSDRYSESIVDSPIFGYATKGDVLGETSSNPLAEEVPGAVLRAQVALVRAAKSAVRNQGPHSLADLRTASASLAAIRDHPDQSGTGGSATAPAP
jgi:hypothetical protein